MMDGAVEKKIVGSLKRAKIIMKILSFKHQKII